MIKTPEPSCHGTPVDKVYPHIKYMYKKIPPEQSSERDKIHFVKDKLKKREYAPD